MLTSMRLLAMLVSNSFNVLTRVIDICLQVFQSCQCTWKPAWQAGSVCMIISALEPSACMRRWAGHVDEGEGQHDRQAMAQRPSGQEEYQELLAL